MKYQTYFDLSTANLNFGFWGFIVIPGIFIVISICIFLGKVPNSISSEKREIIYLWAVLASALAIISIVLISNEVMDTESTYESGEFLVVEGKVTHFRFIKRNSDFAEISLDNGPQFMTSTIFKQIPRSGIPIGSNLRITYSESDNEILKLEIESGQFAEIQKQEEVYRYECFNYAKC